MTDTHRTVRPPSESHFRRLVQQMVEVLAVNTSARYCDEVRELVFGLIADGRIRKLTDLTVGTVQFWAAELVKGGLAPATVINRVSYLSTVCNELVRFGHLKVNPCAGVRLPRKEDKLPHYLEDRDVRRVLKLAQKHGLYVEICLALNTGLRLGELVVLRWEDIDLRKRLLLVRRSKNHRQRTVSLSSEALKVLREQRKAFPDFEWVFPRRQTWRGGFRYHDAPRSKWAWHDALKSIKAKVPALKSLKPHSCGNGWHCFRHTFASRLAQKGISLYKVAEWLGHSDIRTTRIYAHLASGFDADIEAVCV